MCVCDDDLSCTECILSNRMYILQEYYKNTCIYMYDDLFCT